MKKILLLIICILLIVSCSEPKKYKVNGTSLNDYDEYVVYTMNKLHPPVILIGKKGSWDGFKADSIYSIVVKDSLSTIMYYSSDSELSTIIADKYKIGDKIR